MLVVAVERKGLCVGLFAERVAGATTSAPRPEVPRACPHDRHWSFFRADLDERPITTFGWLSEGDAKAHKMI